MATSKIHCAAQSRACDFFGESMMANVPLLTEAEFTSERNGGMNFLQLLQALQRESSTSGAVPSTCQNQVGDFARLVSWLATAWMDIQNERPDWFFTQQPVQFSTLAGQSSYTYRRKPGFLRLPITS